ncbi:DNA topoisomerase 1 [Thermoplasma volcanium GSS1]|uniref:DNA topoisomerase 1 n=1 Tax=Thermoplasma volcanium (strain ATCC 51530 / DSM 4299 / JCM 9571 / NBRC 15438 / GSS1) TaxID=273116 RepID=Q97CT2_THEVO|nr:DNA topoisomerase I [Thermoplasma volcanium]BAB59161.1 DNA topoisomerase 1 [Thermoplasma volcanium GSS1]
MQDYFRVIIAEKVDAGRRIAYFLSNGTAKARRVKGLSYIEFESNGKKTLLIPLSGHIVEADFPENFSNWEKTDLKELIDADIVKKVKNKSAYQTLSSFKGKADEIIIATDYDREGELIGVEALDIIKEGQEKVLRAKFSSLVGQEIRNAFEKPIDVNYNLADAADARESIDLIWGAVLTRFFSLATGRLGRYFLSAGRVQTPTLAIVVEREREIENFKPQTFWTISITFQKEGEFQAAYEKKLFDKDVANSVFSSINGRDGTVIKFEKHEESIRRPTPFSTTEFLREASRIGIMPTKAMSIAESLYTRGLISYPRTDNTVYPRAINLRNVLQKFSKSKYSNYVEEILGWEKIIPSRGRTETTDHPPIYPVEMPKEELKGDYARIYDLILRRFISTLYRDGRKTVKEAEIDVNGYKFLARGSQTTDLGWMAVYGYSSRDEFMPDLSEGEILHGTNWLLNEDQTKPPPRYDMASLLKKMEDLNLGTKSTRHDIIGKLIDRGFIEGNPVRPTGLGIAFIDAVKSVNSSIADPDMTAKLEQDMDKIERSLMSKQEVVDESKKMLHSVLGDFINKADDVKSIINTGINAGEAMGKCPFHPDHNLILSKDKFTYRIRCEVDGCRIDFKIKKNGSISLMDQLCPVCGLPLIKIIRRGQSPEVKCIDPGCAYNKEKEDFGECPKDGGRLILRQSRYGKRFLGCSNYPKCTVTYPLPQKGKIEKTGEKCPICGAPLLEAVNGKRRWKFCPNISCEYNKKKSNKVEEKKAGRRKKDASKS